MTLRNIAFYGLKKSGKTSIIQVLQGNYQNYLGIVPTISVNRYFSEILGNHLTIWDYPEDFQTEKKLSPSNYLSENNIELLIFVIDVQDPSKFEKNLNMIKQIKNCVGFQTVKSISIFFHKFDRVNDSKQEELIKNYQDRIITILEPMDIHLKFYHTSIKNSFSIISAFSDSVFYKMKSSKPMQVLLGNFISNWQIEEIYVFTSNYYKLGAINKNQNSSNEDLTNKILKYLQKLDDTLNIICEMEIPLNDEKLYFSKFYIEKNKKSYPLYVVWKGKVSISDSMKKSVDVLKQTIRFLISPEISPEMICV